MSVPKYGICWVRMRVKICGITSADDALYAAEAGADALGFNFAEAAKGKGRFIDPDKAEAISDKLPPFVMVVAVCVDESVERIHEYLEFVDLVQLHGNEPPDVCDAFGSRAIKAFRVTPYFRAEDMLAYHVGGYLLDAYVEGEPGGTGQTCDWEVARAAAQLDRPLILAGGLTPENVAEAIRRVRPYGVDTASGVESTPGKKSHEKIKAFIHNAKLSVPG